jgi:TonB family protein
MMPRRAYVRPNVTIRACFEREGNVANIRLVQSRGNRDLDHDVVFSAHQASFPFPPKGATVADRTFLVTYVYR